ncbi:hypothetical protein DIPPA_55715 [Diplonema papillatum]|nr:hypothetical protein DIPPA_55715 [Diplonema papillatum]
MEIDPKCFDFRQRSTITCNISSSRWAIWKVLATDPNCLKVKPSCGVSAPGQGEVVSMCLEPSKDTKVKISGRYLSETEVKRYLANRSADFLRELWKEGPPTVNLRPDIISPETKATSMVPSLQPSASAPIRSITIPLPPPAPFWLLLILVALAYTLGVLTSDSWFVQAAD